MIVSVIIPCYNSAPYILKCLDSLEHQIYKDFDVFIVDDNSTDHSVEIVEQYKSKSSLKIYILKNSVNRGPAYSRLQGVKASGSQYICFCDADDWYDADFIYAMVNEMYKNDADVVFTSFRLVFESGRIVEKLNVFSKSILNNKKSILVKAPDSLCLMMIKRHILLDIPHPQIRNGEDMALIPLIITSARNIAAVNTCMYNYYCRENSVSMVPTMKMIDSLIESYCYINSHLSHLYKEEKEFIGVRNLLYGALINLFKFTNDRKKAIQILNDFEADYPKWYRNRNVLELSVPKRVFLFFVKHRLWSIVKFFSHVQMRLLK